MDSDRRAPDLTLTLTLTPFLALTRLSLVIKILVLCERILTMCNDRRRTLTDAVGFVYYFELCPRAVSRESPLCISTAVRRGVTKYGHSHC